MDETDNLTTEKEQSKREGLRWERERQRIRGNMANVEADFT